MDWRDFQAEIEGLTGDERAERARRVIAAHQASIGGDPPSWLLEAAGSRALAEGDLATEDFDAVEVLAIGGPITAIGSPAGGEHITKSRLAQIVEDSRELREAGELRGPVKLGHSQMQALLRASGMTEGELPAAGWVENVRLNEDGTRALADFKKVPKTLAKLIRAGAYRTRSAELRRLVSQKNGKTYEMVIDGVVLQGAKAPAIRTLGDFVKLYAEDDEPGETVGFATVERELSDEERADEYVRRFKEFSTDRRKALAKSGAAMSDGSFPIESCQDASNAINAIGRAPEGKRDAVRAHIRKRVRALSCSGSTFENFGGRSLEERTEALRTAGLIEDFETLAVKNPRPADTRGQMAEMTEEQIRSLAEKLGLEGDDVTPEKIAEAVDGLKTKAEADPETKRELEESELARALEEEKAAREKETGELKTQIETVQEERRLDQRRAFVEGLVEDRKIPPADKDARKKWEDRFDKDAEMARSFAEELPAAEDLTREFGAEGEDEVDDDGKTKADRDYEEDAAARLGLDKEAVI